MWSAHGPSNHDHRTTSPWNELSLRPRWKAITVGSLVICVRIERQHGFDAPATYVVFERCVFEVIDVDNS